MFRALVYLEYIKRENMWYPSCPTSMCRGKKMMEDGSEYHCYGCGGHFSSYDLRYMVQLKLTDDTDVLWVRGFNDVAEQLLGVTANSLRNLFDSSYEEFDRLVGSIVYTNFEGLIRVNAIQREARQIVGFTLVRVYPVDHMRIARSLVNDLEQIISH